MGECKSVIKYFHVGFYESIEIEKTAINVQNPSKIRQDEEIFLPRDGECTFKHPSPTSSGLPSRGEFMLSAVVGSLSRFSGILTYNHIDMKKYESKIRHKAHQCRILRIYRYCKNNA